MEICELEELFRVKIGLEMQRFRKKMLKQEKDVIFDRAYQIDCVIAIYEQLLEMSSGMQAEYLKVLLTFPNLLQYLYSCWLKETHSYMKELQGCLDGSIQSLADAYSRIAQEESMKKVA